MPKKCTLDELQKNRKISRLTTRNFNLFRDGDYIRDASIREHQESPTLSEESNTLDKDTNSSFVDASSFDTLKKDSSFSDSGKNSVSFIDGAKKDSSKLSFCSIGIDNVDNQKTSHRTLSDVSKKDSAKFDSVKKGKSKLDIAREDGAIIDGSNIDSEIVTGVKKDSLGSTIKISEVSATPKFSNEKNLNIGQSQRLRDNLAKKDPLKDNRSEYYNAKSDILKNKDGAIFDRFKIDSENYDSSKNDILNNVSKINETPNTSKFSNEKNLSSYQEQRLEDNLVKNDRLEYYSANKDRLENVSDDGVKYNTQTQKPYTVSSKGEKGTELKVDKDKKEKSYNRAYTESTKIFHYNSKEEANALGEKNFTFGIDTFVIDKLFARIESPVACVVYIYLWRRTIGQGQEKIKISAKVIGDVLNFNRRTIIMAIRHLNEKNLIHTEGLGQLGIHEHKILRDWV